MKASNRLYNRFSIKGVRVPWATASRGQEAMP